MKAAKSYIAVCLLLLLTITGCKETETVISDNDFYENISRALVDCYISIYNQNVAGYPEGAVDKTVNGPLGGTVHITGNVTSGGGTTSTDLLLSLTNVSYVYAYGYWSISLVLTGDVTYNGSFSGSYVSVNHQSSNLNMQGTVQYKQTTRSVANLGAVSINRTTSGTTAVIFGHAVAY